MTEWLAVASPATPAHAHAHRLAPARLRAEIRRHRGTGRDRPQSPGFRHPGEIDAAQVDEQLQALVAADRAVNCRWITDEELDAQPELVRTLSVQPPRGAGRIRLLEIAGIDLQPCGGTHVRSTGEAGRLVVTRIENKGRRNRRVYVGFA